jgi:glycosyltransferase involved in cell wall biosynthesis
MKIVLVHNTYLEQGGEDVVFWQERELLRAAGHEVLEFHRDNHEMEQYSMVQRLTVVGRIVWSSDCYDEFTTLLREQKPDVVHVHNTFPLISPSILWACQRENVPVVHTLHNYRLLCPGANFIRDGKPCEDCLQGNIWQSVAHGCYRDSRAQTAAVALMLSVHRGKRTWTEAVDHYIVLTEFARSRFVNGGLPSEKITVKPNCVDPDPGERAREGSYALYVGRVSTEKGTPTLFQAWRQLPADLPLRIVGDGPAYAELQSEAANLGLKNITFVGRVPRDRVIQEMKGARVLVFPSQLYENFPLTILEAYACGVPVIASRLGAMAEVVQEGRTGLFFEAGNPDDLARTLKQAWEQPELLRALGRQARLEYEASYTAAANYRQLMAIYQRVIRDRATDAEGLRAEDLQEVTPV